MFTNHTAMPTTSQRVRKRHCLDLLGFASVGSRYESAVFDAIPDGCRRALDVRCGNGELTQGFELVSAVASLHHMDAREGLVRLRSLIAPGGVLVGLAPPNLPRDLPIESRRRSPACAGPQVEQASGVGSVMPAISGSNATR
jgi:hypothetical protein